MSYHNKRHEDDGAWLAKAPAAIEKALAYMEKCATEAEPTPQMLRAVAGAVKLVTEAIAAREIIDARFRDELGESGERTGQVAPTKRRTRGTG